MTAEQQQAIAQLRSMSAFVNEDDAGRVVDTIIRTPATDDQTLKLVALFPDLDDLGLLNSKVTFAGLSLLRADASPAALGLQASLSIDDRACEIMGAYQNTVSLSLKGTSISDAGLVWLAKMPRLRSLDLSCTAITADGLQVFTSMTGLHALMIGETQIGDEGLRHIGEIRSLRGLWAPKTPITSAGLKYLTKLPELTELLLYYTAIDDAGAEILSRIASLKVLLLTGTKITNRAIKDFKKLRELKSLSVRDTMLDDDCLDDLAQLTWVERIDIIGTKISPGGMERLKSKLPNTGVVYMQVTQ